MKRLLLQIVSLFFIFAINAENLKVLHLTLHKGVANEFEGVAKELGLDLTTWFIHAMPPRSFDPASHGTVLYNVGHDRAKRIWEAHKDFFNSFDVIVTSDTAPLARIFLQNNFQKHLVIWVCNRFDYYDAGNLDCHFPDPEYYDLFRAAARNPKVTIAGYTPFENHYAASKGVPIGSLVLKPCSPVIKEFTKSSIPSKINKPEYVHVTNRSNETIFMNLSHHLTRLGIKNYCGNYNGPRDLVDFKGVVCLPYAWSNIALFENLQLGIVCFIPSPNFFRSLLSQPNYWFCNSEYLFWDYGLTYIIEWYNPKYKDGLVYFDSWQDLVHKINTIDYEKVSAAAKACGESNKEMMLRRWKKVFDGVKKT